jgi:hypothetical protein
VLKAKCQAVIRVEIVERNTNMPIEISELREEMILQMAILDGNTYDAKFEAGMENEFESCLLLMNNKVRSQAAARSPLAVLLAEPLSQDRRVARGLVPSGTLARCAQARAVLQGSPTLVGMAVSNDQHGFIRVPLTSSRAVLPDLRVTDSSEAMLSGRKPPLRLMMCAVYKDTLQPVPHIRHAISEGFVVAVRSPTTCVYSFMRRQGCVIAVEPRRCSAYSLQFLSAQARRRFACMATASCLLCVCGAALLTPCMLWRQGVGGRGGHCSVHVGTGSTTPDLQEGRSGLDVRRSVADTADTDSRQGGDSVGG